MLTTNLLSLSQKKKIAREELRRLIRYIAFGFGFALLIGVTLLFPSFLPLRFERAELERAKKVEEDASHSLKIGEVSEKSKKLNYFIAGIKTATEESNRASSLLSNILGKQRVGITILNVIIRKNGEMLLSGVATTRQDLLNFEGALRDSGIFQEISSPLSNIIREQNINFTMEGKLKTQFIL